MELMGVGWNRLVTGPLVSGAPNTVQLQHMVPIGRLGLVARYRHLGLFFGQVAHRQLITSLPPGVETWHHYGQAELNWAW